MSNSQHQSSHEPASMAAILSAIVDDDCLMANELLKVHPLLASGLITQPRLYETKITHWIYVGDTALHLAAAGHRVELVRLLLGAGADPNSTQNRRKSGPLHYAADGCIASPDWDAKPQVQTIQSLLEAGDKINAQDKNGASPLHRAVRTRCSAAVKCLLDKGSDPHLRNKSGSTPFHLAVQNTGRGGSGAEEAKEAQRQIIRHFLAFGVKTSLRDGKGKSVIDCATSTWIRNMLE